MCRVPTRDDYVNEAKARNAPHPEFRQRCGREHPFINCSTSLNDAFNIWHVPPGPHWWQYRMCLDVAQPAGMNSAAQSLSLRWLLYHARCRVHHTVCLCLSNPPLAMPNRISSFSPTVLLKSTRASLAALTSRVSHRRRTPGSRRLNAHCGGRTHQRDWLRERPREASGSAREHVHRAASGTMDVRGAGAAASSGPDASC